MNRLLRLIKDSFNKFQIDLEGKVLLTEAATGNFVCTPILSAMAGARVFAIAKDSKYGSVYQAQDEVLSLTKELNIKDKITIIQSLDEIDLGNLDIVTNTGFVRPVDKFMIDKLKPDCVIPLMWEPWEFRPDDLDLESAVKKGIKVYGTNESDYRLQTMRYIGLTVLYFLLKEKRTPFSSKILVIGCEKFNKGIEIELRKLNYSVSFFLTDKFNASDIREYDTIIVAEHINPELIIGNIDSAKIESSSFSKEQLIIHISGNVDFNSLTCKHYPDIPAPFGYMSYTTDFIDPIAVFDLHSAGLKVAEGMIKANFQNLISLEYKNFMETNYPARAFEKEKYW
jgi:hypothetical protein